MLLLLLMIMYDVSCGRFVFVREQSHSDLEKFGERTLSHAGVVSKDLFPHFGFIYFF